VEIILRYENQKIKTLSSLCHLVDNRLTTDHPDRALMAHFLPEEIRSSISLLIPYQLRCYYKKYFCFALSRQSKSFFDFYPYPNFRMKCYYPPLKQKLCLTAGLIALMMIVPLVPSFAQCNCKFTIPAGSTYVYFDGAAKGVLPGDVICVQAGIHSTIQFINIKGMPGNPVIIRNCGGQALIGGPTASNGMLFTGSRYVHVTGTGDSGFTYGLKVVQTIAGSQGLAYAGLSSDIEIDHMEIQKAGYVAIMAKTDPSKNCADVSAVRPNFTLYNVSIHDNYIHDSGGEGIYLGDSFYSGTLVFCGRTQYCHEVRGVRIYNNRFENTGRESGPVPPLMKLL